MTHHWPIARTVLAAVTPLAAVIILHPNALEAMTLSLVSASWFLVGVVHTQLFEYWCHRVPMHRGFPFLSNVKWNHLDHHRIFYGANFQSRDLKDLEHIAGRYWVFPLLFLAHYAILAPVLEAAALIPFFLGSVLHYVVFEITHWLTHIEGNVIDRAIARVPMLADVRAYQIEHHRIHHEVPELAFNFNPPYLGDRLAGHMPTGQEIRPGDWTGIAEPVDAPAMSMAQPAPEPVPIRHAWRRRLVRYGSAAAVGIAVVGAVVVAHGLITHGKRVIPSPEHTI